jgi:hypothetical protein
MRGDCRVCRAWQPQTVHLRVQLQGWMAAGKLEPPVGRTVAQDRCGGGSDRSDSGPQNTAPGRVSAHKAGDPSSMRMLMQDELGLDGSSGSRGKGL